MAMMLGLSGGNIPRQPNEFTKEIAKDWARQGLRCLATNFSWSHDEVAAAAPKLRALLADEGIHVAQFAGVNANFVHYDEEVRRVGRDSVRAAARAAAALGVTMLSSGCGTNSPDYLKDFYAPDARNYAPEASDRLISELKQIVPIIEDAGILYTIECHQLSTMRSSEVIREILDSVDSPSITANFDPVNLLDSAVAVFDSASRMLHMVDTVGPRYGPSCHVKDIRLTNEFVCHILEVPPGEGVLDYEGYFLAASKLPGPTALIVEHLSPEQSIEGVRFVREMAVANGIELL